MDVCKEDEGGDELKIQRYSAEIETTWHATVNFEDEQHGQLLSTLMCGVTSGYCLQGSQLHKSTFTTMPTSTASAILP
jgi:hypothetical protein